MNSHRCCRRLAMFLLPALLLSWSGCTSTSHRSSVPRPGGGLNEYLNLVAQSQQAVQSAITSLDAVEAAAPTPSKKRVSAFSKEIDRLASASVRIRARSQAMQARGDAYFENWRDNMSSVADPEIRALAEQNRAGLQQSFGKVKTILQRTRIDFQSFLAGLRELRTKLEIDPAALGVAANQKLAQSTGQSGRSVQEGLAQVADELNTMVATITPKPSASSH